MGVVADGDYVRVGTAEDGNDGCAGMAEGGDTCPVERSSSLYVFTMVRTMLRERRRWLLQRETIVVLQNKEESWRGATRRRDREARDGQKQGETVRCGKRTAHEVSAWLNVAQRSESRTSG